MLFYAKSAEEALRKFNAASLAFQPPAAFQEVKT
jgi:hypothetical protein